jgi:hypothetical protein
LKQKCLKNLNLNQLNFDERIQWISKYIGLTSNDNSITLDQLLLKSEEPIFIKMDIDGGEVEALQSCIKSLDNKFVYWLSKLILRNSKKTVSLFYLT